ncbi:hypothetical protein AAT22_01710 [Clostridium sp. C8]|nr:hypothetical protein AAT22_01710 [Clostridium sp. C8]
MTNFETLDLNHLESITGGSNLDLSDSSTWGSAADIVTLFLYNVYGRSTFIGYIDSPYFQYHINKPLGGYKYA